MSCWEKKKERIKNQRVSKTQRKILEKKKMLSPAAHSARRRLKKTIVDWELNSSGPQPLSRAWSAIHTQVLCSSVLVYKRQPWIEPCLGPAWYPPHSPIWEPTASRHFSHLSLLRHSNPDRFIQRADSLLLKLTGEFRLCLGDWRCECCYYLITHVQGDKSRNCYTWKFNILLHFPSRCELLWKDKSWFSYSCIKLYI